MQTRFNYLIVLVALLGAVNAQFDCPTECPKSTGTNPYCAYDIAKFEALQKSSEPAKKLVTVLDECSKKTAQKDCDEMSKCMWTGYMCSPDSSVLMSIFPEVTDGTCGIYSQCSSQPTSDDCGKVSTCEWTDSECQVSVKVEREMMYGKDKKCTDYGVTNDKCRKASGKETECKGITGCEYKSGLCRATITKDFASCKPFLSCQVHSAVPGDDTDGGKKKCEDDKNCKMQGSICMPDGGTDAAIGLVFKLSNARCAGLYAVQNYVSMCALDYSPSKQNDKGKSCYENGVCALSCMAVGAGSLMCAADMTAIVDAAFKKDLPEVAAVYTAMNKCQMAPSMASFVTISESNTEAEKTKIDSASECAIPDLTTLTRKSASSIVETEVSRLQKLSKENEKKNSSASQVSIASTLLLVAASFALY